MVGEVEQFLELAGDPLNMRFFENTFMGTGNHPHGGSFAGILAPAVKMIKGAKELMTLAAKQGDVAVIRFGMVMEEGQNVRLPEFLLVLGVGRKVDKIFHVQLDTGLVFRGTEK